MVAALNLLGQTATQMPSLTYLISVLVIAVGILLILILRYNVQAFLALLICSLLVAVLASKEVTGADNSLEISEIGNVIQSGMGSSLGFIAAIIGLGAIFGALLEHSGGAQRLATSMIKIFGEKRANWAMMLTGFVISIPVFFDVALVIVAPIIYALARRTGKTVLAFALPLLVGISVTHAFVPPTPGPVWVAYELQVSLGKVIIYGLIVGLPTAVICGIFLSSMLAKQFHIDPPELLTPELDERSPSLPGFGLILGLIGFPILLIVVAAVMKEILASGIDSGLSKSDYRAAYQTALSNSAVGYKVIAFLGHPIIALISATVAALVFLGYRRGVDRKELMDVCTKSLGPAGIIILITGAGGVFKMVLGATGVSEALKTVFQDSGWSVLFLAYIFAVFVRVAQGSATIAMVAAAGLVASMTTDLSQSQLALVVIAIAAGASTASHVNDSGFWMVCKYFRMNESQTLRTWTILSTAVSVVGYTIAQILWFFV